MTEKKQAYQESVLEYQSLLSEQRSRLVSLRPPPPPPPPPSPSPGVIPAPVSSPSPAPCVAPASPPPPVLRPRGECAASGTDKVLHGDDDSSVGPLRSDAQQGGGASKFVAAVLIAVVIGMFAGMAITTDADDGTSQLRRLASSPVLEEGSSASRSEALVDSRSEALVESRSEALVESRSEASSDGAASTGMPLDAVTDEPVVVVAKTVTPSVVRISTDYGQGSGIVWDSEEGYIVTNHHVIQDPYGENADTVKVTLADGTELEGEVKGGSSSQDVAVVKVDPDDANLVAAEFAGTASVEVGQLAVAIGSPFDLAGTVTSGIVSSIRINLYGGSDPNSPVPVEMIQTDAPINPGNSGGALANRQGRVIGMNTSIQTMGAMGNVGVGFALPSDTVQLIAERIVEGESLDLGYLGLSSEVGIHDEEGVLVTIVVENSPADDAGIRVGDVIVALESEPMHDIATLSATVKLYRPGDAVEVIIQRDGELFATTVKLGSYNDS